MFLFLVANFSLLIAQKPVVTEIATWPTAATVLESGESLVGYGDGTIAVLDPVTGKRQALAGQEKKETGVFAKLSSKPWFLAPDPKGEILLVSRRNGLLDRLSTHYTEDEQGHVKLLPTPKGWPTLKLDEPSDEYGARALWTQSGSHFVTWTADNYWNHPHSAMQVWTRKGKLVWQGPKVRWVAVSPTQNQIAAVLKDEFLLMRPGSEPKRFPLKGALGCIAFSPDGKRLLVAGLHRQMWFVKAEDGSIQSTFTIEGDMFGMADPSVVRLAWSPNGKWIGLTSVRGVIPSILDGQDGHWIDTLGYQGSQMGRIHPSFWTSENQFLGGMTRMSILDPKTGVKRKLHHSRSIRGVASPPGSTHAIIWAHGTVIGLDLMTLKPSWRHDYISPKQKRTSLLGRLLNAFRK